MIVSDIAVYVLKKDIKIQPTNQPAYLWIRAYMTVNDLNSPFHQILHKNYTVSQKNVHILLFQQFSQKSVNLIIFSLQNSEEIWLVYETAHHPLKMSPHYLVKSKQVIFHNKSSWVFTAAAGQVFRAWNWVSFFHLQETVHYASLWTFKIIYYMCSGKQEKRCVC